LLIEIAIATEIGSIGGNVDNDPDFDFDFDRAALQELDASAKMSAPQGTLGVTLLSHSPCR
jgi:hypothetical protein